MNTSENELELVDVVALGARYSREVDVEEGVIRQVRLPGRDDGVGDVQSEIGVDLAVQRGRLVPCSWAARDARESKSGDLRLLGGVNGGSNGSGERKLDIQIATDVGACDGKLGGRAIPELGCGHRDTRLDGRDRERVDVVEARVCGVGTCCWASTRAGGKYAAIRVNSLGCGIG